MPARKNKPGKFGTSAEAALTPKHRQVEQNSLERALVDKLIVWEGAHPKLDHYIDWADMEAAESLAKKGYLVYGGLATGCFCVTDLFRRTFIYNEGKN